MLNRFFLGLVYSLIKVIIDVWFFNFIGFDYVIFKLSFKVFYYFDDFFL